MSAFIKVLSMSTVTTWRCSIASIRTVNKSASVVILGVIVSSLVRYSLSFLPSEQPFPLDFYNRFSIGTSVIVTLPSFLHVEFTLGFWGSWPSCSEDNLSISGLSLIWIPQRLPDPWKCGTGSLWLQPVGCAFCCLDGHIDSVLLRKVTCGLFGQGQSPRYVPDCLCCSFLFDLNHC